MQNTMLLECIWKGEILATQSDMSKEITRLLGLIMPIRTVPLGAKSGFGRSCVFSENIELLPEIHLGDVLAEELSVDVPYESMVVIFKEIGEGSPKDRAAVSSELGLLIGDALLNLIKDCVFPIQCEAEVLLVMVNSYCDLIDSPEFQKQDVCSRSFREGLILSLKEYWAGQIQSKLAKSAPDLNLRKEAARKSRYLKNVDTHVGRQMFGQKSVNLTKLQHNVFSGKDWKTSLSEAVMGEIHRDTARVNNYYG